MAQKFEAVVVSVNKSKDIVCFEMMPSLIALQSSRSRPWFRYCYRNSLKIFVPPTIFCSDYAHDPDAETRICSGLMHDLAHVLTQYCLADPQTKKSVSSSLLISTVRTGVLREIDVRPPFRAIVQHKASVSDVLYPDPEANEDYCTHLMSGRTGLLQ